MKKARDVYFIQRKTTMQAAKCAWVLACKERGIVAFNPDKIIACLQADQRDRRLRTAQQTFEAVAGAEQVVLNRADYEKMQTDADDLRTQLKRADQIADNLVIALNKANLQVENMRKLSRALHLFHKNDYSGVPRDSRQQLSRLKAIDILRQRLRDAGFDPL